MLWLSKYIKFSPIGLVPSLNAVDRRDIRFDKGTKHGSYQAAVILRACSKKNSRPKPLGIRVVFHNREDRSILSRQIAPMAAFAQP